ncbi:hypothetical protein RF55_18339 [Lasius niger]|uniref:Uncharacterized protein n=1 Tax=Lasius niger TaxID=67767 RepID=A0A0J7K137_LASNI|nr:hypothetical protein RF55_18339 [Lasius niger]
MSQEVFPRPKEEHIKRLNPTSCSCRNGFYFETLGEKLLETMISQDLMLIFPNLMLSKDIFRFKEVVLDYRAKCSILFLQNN